jgi:hypothetical protein
MVNAPSSCLSRDTIDKSSRLSRVDGTASAWETARMRYMYTFPTTPSRFDALGASLFVPPSLSCNFSFRTPFDKVRVQRAQQCPCCTFWGKRRSLSARGRTIGGRDWLPLFRPVPAIKSAAKRAQAPVGASSAESVLAGGLGVETSGTNMSASPPPSDAVGAELWIRTLLQG